MQGSARIKRLKGKALIEDNGYSGEYAPVFSNRLHPCSVLIEINNVVYTASVVCLTSKAELTK